MPRPPRPRYWPLGPVARLRWKLSPTRIVIQAGVGRGRRSSLLTFFVFSGLAALKRAVSRHPERVAVDQLDPGQRIIVRTFPVTSAKQRKQLLRGQN